MELKTYTETAEELARDYITRAEGVVNSDPDFRRDNPDMTVRDYALDLIDGDIETAVSTGQTEWKGDLEKIRKLILSLPKSKGE